MIKDKIKKGILSFLKDLFEKYILSEVKSAIKRSINEVQKAVYLTLKKVMHSILAFMMLITGILMLVISLPFLLSHYLNIPSSLLFAIMGLLLLIISTLFFARINKTKYF